MPQIKPIASGAHRSDPWLLLAGGAGMLFLLVAVIFLPQSRWLLYGDFAVFYQAVQDLRAGRPLYVVGDMPYLNPPFFALLIAPLGFLPYEVARRLWTVLALLTTAGACRLLLGSGPATPGRRAWLWATLLSTPVLLGDVQVGQNSVCVLLGVAAWYALQRRGHKATAGLALALGLVKPQLLVGVVVALVAGRRWRELAGFAAGASALAALSMALVGWDGVAGYLAVAREVGTWVARGAFYRVDMHTPNALLHEYLPVGLAAPLVVLTASAVIALLGRRVAETRLADPTSVSLAVLGTFLIAPYAHVSDLMLLTVPWLLLGPTANGWRQALLVVTFFAPFATYLSHAFGGPAQLTVLANLALFTHLLTGRSAGANDQRQP